jgi:hypothetical protein
LLVLELFFFAVKPSPLGTVWRGKAARFEPKVAVSQQCLGYITIYFTNQSL